MKPTKSDLPQGTLDLLILKVVALACGLPARRAARSDPAALLRFE